MKSKWFGYKEQVLLLRSQGTSMTTIEREFGIARSTLSGWFKEVPLTELQRSTLANNSADGWALARKKAVETHRARKAKRLADADSQAKLVIDSLEITDATLDLAFAMLYLGEGAKNDRTSISSSEPKILRLTLYILQRNYGVSRQDVRCELHLRMDQDEVTQKQYWSDQLRIPIDRFGYTAFDKRSAGKKTYDHYPGVCVLNCGSISIQRKLISLYNQFCQKIELLDLGT